MKDREIDEILSQAAPAPRQLEPGVAARIAEGLRPSMRPVRPLPPPWMLVAGLWLIIAAVAFAGAYRAGFDGIEKMDLSMRILIFPTLAILAWMDARELVNAMIPGSRRRFSAGTLLAATVGLLLGVFALLFHDYQTTQFVSAGIACLITGLLHAAPAALLSWLLLRRGFAMKPVSAGLIAGTLAGLAGLGVLELHCVNFQAMHILVWHTAVVPASGALGALAGWIAGFLSRLQLRRGGASMNRK